MPTPQARTALVLELQKFGGLTIYIPTPSRAARRRRAAENILAQGMSRAEAACVLKERFQVAMRTAQRDVANASRELSRENGAIAANN